MAGGLGPRLLALALALGPAGVSTQLRLVESGGGLRAPGDSVQLSCQVSTPNFEDYSVRWFRQARGGCLEWVSYISSRSGVCSELKLVESGGGLRAPGDSVHLSCQGSGFSFEDYYDVLWYRQAPGGSLEWLSLISYDVEYAVEYTVEYTVEYGKAVKGRASVSRDNSQSKSSLSLSSLVPQDSAHYFCAVRTGTGNPAEL